MFDLIAQIASAGDLSPYGLGIGSVIGIVVREVFRCLRDAPSTEAERLDLEIHELREDLAFHVRIRRRLHHSRPVLPLGRKETVIAARESRIEELNPPNERHRARIAWVQVGQFHTDVFERLDVDVVGHIVVEGRVI